MLQEAEISDTHIGFCSCKMTNHIQKKIKTHSQFLNKTRHSSDAIWTLKLWIQIARSPLPWYTMQSIHVDSTPAPGCFQNSFFSRSYLRFYGGAGKKVISIGFLSQSSTAATITKIRMLESPRDNSRTDKQCHTRVDERTVNGVVSSLVIPSTLRTGHEQPATPFSQSLYNASVCQCSEQLAKDTVHHNTLQLFE